MITFTLETITPKVAAEYLTRNVKNRAMSQGRVKALSRDMLSNAFLVTHQCIAFNVHGELIDGQHRLAAVVSSGVAVKMYVARYEREETAMALPFDMGMTRRPYDVLDISRKESEIATAILRLQSADKKFTAHDIQACVDAHRDAITRLLAECSSHTAKHRSSAGAKSAIVLLCERYKEHSSELMSQFNKFLSMDLDGMWSSVAACVRALDNLNGSGGGFIQKAVAVRVWYAFKPENRDLKLIRIMDENALVKEMMTH